MFQLIDKVGEFHRAFNVKPKSLIHNLELRVKLLWEEFNELKDAKDPVEQLDALTDMLYIASGTLEQYDPLAFSNNDTFIFEVRALKDIMEDIEFTPSYHRFISLHIELVNTVVHEANRLGFDIFGAFDEVHSSNMSKLDDNGKPVLRADGKVLKGPNYRPPRLEKYTVKEADVTRFTSPT
jgi:predicted HAD superfamily Cof-like phosphohydrolase